MSKPKHDAGWKPPANKEKPAPNVPSREDPPKEPDEGDSGDFVSPRSDPPYHDGF